MSAQIAEKIAKIIAKAESTTSPDEAETFMVKAREMMVAHGITMLDLGTLDQDDPVGVSMGLTKSGSGDTWQVKMAAALALYFGAKIVVTKIRNVTYHHAIGRESARMTYALMFPYVKKQVSKLATKAYEEGRHETPARARSAIGSALTYRLALLAQEDRRAPRGTGINALVPVDVIQAAMEDAFPALRAGRNTKLRFGHDDLSDANGVSLAHQTTGGKATLRLS